MYVKPTGYTTDLTTFLTCRICIHCRYRKHFGLEKLPMKSSLMVRSSLCITELLTQTCNSHVSHHRCLLEKCLCFLNVKYICSFALVLWQYYQYNWCLEVCVVSLYRSSNTNADVQVNNIIFCFKVFTNTEPLRRYCFHIYQFGVFWFI